MLLSSARLAGFALSPTVRLRLTRTNRLGPWAREVYDVSRGRRASLSASALASLHAQRREMRTGYLVGAAYEEAVRDLAVMARSSA